MAKKPVSLELALAGEAQAGEGGATVIPFTPPRPTYEKLTVYVPRSAAKRIKQMALDHDRRVNDFLQEGVELMLAKYGQPSLKELGL